MKIKTANAARALGIHPSHLLLHVAELDRSLSFGDVWPEIDQEWVKTVEASRGHRQPTPAPSPELPKLLQPTPSPSDDAVHVLDKLSRKDKWGNASVTLDALLNLTHLDRHRLQKALDELRKLRFLGHDGRGQGKISLAPGRRNEIERVTHRQGLA